MGGLLPAGGEGRLSAEAEKQPAGKLEGEGLAGRVGIAGEPQTAGELEGMRLDMASTRPLC